MYAPWGEIIKLKEWLEIEEGIKQRIKALNLFLKDIYHEQFILNKKYLWKKIDKVHSNTLILEI